jgi:cysteinyl-tRNA synthetase
MELKLYDTLTREKRLFKPLDPANVRMYVCGPTVYDFAHIGNARPAIVFDVLFRLLRHLYGADRVTYVRNITDVDDKINARAAEEYPALPLNEAIREVTEKTDKQFHEDVAALGCLAPIVEPRATEHIAEMRELIERLVKSGNAYVADDHVLFSVPSMPDYGRLSNRTLDEMIEGTRVEVAPFKRDPLDFVLWKPSKPAEPAWPSPCGIDAPGRPGWHIECSAMSWKHLGETFDIHGGGIDLVFPHHENEIAQSRCAFHTPVMANYWMHNGFLQVEGEKMAKSAGNFITIRQLMRVWKGEPWSGPVIRLAMLSTHYRHPIDWTRDRLVGAKADVAVLSRETGVHQLHDEGHYDLAWKSEPRPSAEILSALNDDLNTPLAVSSVRERIAKTPHLSTEALLQLVWDVRFLGIVSEKQRKWLTASIGLSQMPPQLVDRASIQFRDYRVFSANSDSQVIESAAANLESINVQIQDASTVQYAGRDLTSGQIERMIDNRNSARAAKNFVEADRIRDELAKMGVVLKDTKNGTTWDIAR